MKRYIKSSSLQKKSTIQSSTDTTYTDRFNYRLGGTSRFSVYTKYADDPERFQCQISEIHPYDLAEYYWIKKDQPASAKVIKNGKVAGRIELREYDEDDYEDSNEYIRDIVEYMCRELMSYNSKIEPRIDHT